MVSRGREVSQSVGACATPCDTLAVEPKELIFHTPGCTAILRGLSKLIVTHSRTLRISVRNCWKAETLRQTAPSSFQRRRCSTAEALDGENTTCPIPSTSQPWFFRSNRSKWALLSSIVYNSALGAIFERFSAR